MTKHARALYRMRYLCDSGLRSEVVIPLVMEELKRLVRFGAWVFAWSNARSELVNSAMSPMRPETLRYFVEHFDNLARDVGFSIHDAIRTFPAVSNPRRTGRLNPGMDETESYREVWGPEGAYFNLTLAVRGADERPLGVIQVFRPKEDTDFDLDDEASIHVVLPYLRRLLLREVVRFAELPLIQDGLAGVAVFPEDDGPQFISDRAYDLSVMALNDKLPITSDGLQIVDPADRLNDMCRDVRRASQASGTTTAGGESSSVRLLSNERGVFTFEWEPSLRKGVRVWSVVIRHKIPARARLMYMPEGALLSTRQLEVARRLLDGESIPQIADQIGVRPATLKDHTREIYRKFGVSDRNQLLRKIVESTPRIG